jgi:hypothetical protein
MVNVATGPVFEEIGQIIADLVEGDPNGSYLYVEVEEAFQAPSLFKDHGNEVICYRPSLELCDAIKKLWEMEPDEKKWQAMHYEVENNRFNARFEFAEQFDADEWVDDRLDRAVVARYGDRPITYPKPDGNYQTLTLDDFADDQPDPA